MVTLPPPFAALRLRHLLGQTYPLIRPVISTTSTAHVAGTRAQYVSDSKLETDWKRAEHLRKKK
jgi:hypothetical protein